MEDKPIIQSWTIHKYENQSVTQLEDEVAVEFALTIVINGKEYATMVCSPCQLEELVIGFLASEALILTYEEIQTLQVDVGAGFAYVDLKKELLDTDWGRTKRFIGSCCGKSREFYYTQDAKTARTIVHKHQIIIEDIIHLMKAFQQQSDDFKRTGGVHQAALASKESIQYRAVDIGRHNALDKVYGYMLREHSPRRNAQIVFSGRISSEVLLKVAKIGIGFILSPSAPTDLALRLANDLNITTVGFIRNNRLNIYTHPENIIHESTS
ncbi:formate dehydrogenase accessory sulfurtransferase FdhD [Pontibacillus salicampi]|uniref:Sulfur carrier protein FdhD n=1 Tax=Pontibacillus salicampi TaxID=1449801 RepID=A0ABV6LIB7_9BACI